MAVWILTLLMIGGMVAAFIGYAVICVGGCVWPLDDAWNRRQEVVELILAGELDGGSESGVITLPQEYRDLASGGEVIVDGDVDSMIIVFWREAEMHGHRVLVYAPSGVAEGPFLDTCAVYVDWQGGSWHEVGLAEWADCD